MLELIHVYVTPEQRAFLEWLVKEKKYTSMGEPVREALGDFMKKIQESENN